MSEPENPPAFPVPEVRIDGMGISEGSPGMTLRDWFAGRAPVTMFDAAICCGWSGLDAANISQDSYRQTVWSVLTLMRYEYADAMLEQRARATGQQS